MVIHIPYLLSIKINFHIDFHLGRKNSVEKEVIKFLEVKPGYRKRKIPAIKYVKENTEINDLRKAKKFVDKIEEKYNL